MAMEPLCDHSDASARFLYLTRMPRAEAAAGTGKSFIAPGGQADSLRRVLIGEA